MLNTAPFEAVINDLREQTKARKQHNLPTPGYVLVGTAFLENLRYFACVPLHCGTGIVLHDGTQVFLDIIKESAELLDTPINLEEKTLACIDPEIPGITVPAKVTVVSWKDTPPKNFVAKTLKWLRDLVKSRPEYAHVWGHRGHYKFWDPDNGQTAILEPF